MQIVVVDGDEDLVVHMAPLLIAEEADILGPCLDTLIIDLDHSTATLAEVHQLVRRTARPALHSLDRSPIAIVGEINQLTRRSARPALRSLEAA
eukprot:25883-Eustigmatos_ZCMA.PRE.1